jgi:competence protein ComEC
VIRPWNIVEAGFQLSFAGAAAVGYAHGEALRSAWLRAMPRLVKATLLSLLTSSAAVLLVSPITAIHFGRVTPAAVVGNLLAVPLLALAMPAMFTSAALSAWPALAVWPTGAAVVLLQAIDSLAGALSSVAWASLDVSRPGVLWATMYTCLLILAAQALHGAWQRRRFILAVGLICAVSIAWPPLRSRVGPDRITIYVLDVGQGDAIAIATPNRRWLLVDAGAKINDFDAGRSRVVPFLRGQGVRQLVAWMASHPDLDHVGGAVAVLESVSVDRVVGSGWVSGQSGQLALLTWLSSHRVPWLRANRGTQISVDDVKLQFLHPEDQREADYDGGPNAYSLVFRLEYGRFRMLFTGDAPGDIEDGLSRDLPEALSAQVLKVSHHGSASSTSSGFLTAVDPELAVISVGRGNRYGHPSPHVLWRLSAQGADIRRTDRDGTVVIEAGRDGSWRVRAAAQGYF